MNLSKEGSWGANNYILSLTIKLTFLVSLFIASETLAADTSVDKCISADDIMHEIRNIKEEMIRLYSSLLANQIVLEDINYKKRVLQSSINEKLRYDKKIDEIEEIIRVNKDRIDKIRNVKFSDQLKQDNDTNDELESLISIVDEQLIELKSTEKSKYDIEGQIITIEYEIKNLTSKLNKQ